MKNEFEPAANAVGLLLRDLEVIIAESERAKINHAKQGEPNEPIARTSPDEARHKDRSDGEHAPHGWRALFTAMQFGKTVNFCRCANGLSQLQRGQFSNDEISKNQRD